MKKFVFPLILIFLAILGIGYFLAKSKSTAPSQKSFVPISLGVTSTPKKLLSPEQYRALINEKDALAALARLRASSSTNSNIQKEIDNALADIKNNCNLSIDSAVVLPVSVAEKFKKAYVCRYVKGAQSGNRVDEFTLKFIGDQPFEFGLSGSLEFDAGFGSLVLKEQKTEDLVQNQAGINTILGSAYFDSATAAPSAVVGAGAGSSTIQAENSNAKIYLAVLGDNGAAGKLVGCGDSLVSVGVNVDFSKNADSAQKAKEALQKLFSLRDKIYDKNSGLINPLYNSVLNVDRIAISGSIATVELTGNLRSDGLCDTEIIEEQIKQTVKQFVGANSVELSINKPEQEDIF